MVIPFLCISSLISKQLQNTTKLVFLEESYVNHLLCPHPLTIACRITAIVLSRFILDLRRDPDEHATSAVTQPTLQFAQRLEDGLGGSLSGTWRSEIDEDEVDEITASPEHLEVLNGEHRME